MKTKSLAKSPKIRTIFLVSDTNKRGRLEVVHGSMFGGKTEHMIARLRQAESHGHCVMAFKHAIDDRYDPDHLVTHRKDRFDAIRVPDGDSILALCNGADLVAIDEGHFFKNALIPVVQSLLDRGITVIVSGITHDAWGRPFEPMPKLSDMADEEVLRQAPCRVCGEPSPYTQRMTDVDTLHMVGGLDDYEPRCAAHFTPLATPPESR